MMSTTSRANVGLGDALDSLLQEIVLVLEEDRAIVAQLWTALQEVGIWAGTKGYDIPASSQVNGPQLIERQCRTQARMRGVLQRLPHVIQAGPASGREGRPASY